MHEESFIEAAARLKATPQRPACEIGDTIKAAKTLAQKHYSARAVYSPVARTITDDSRAIFAATGWARRRW